MESANFLWWIVWLPLLGSAACAALHLIDLRQRPEPGACGPWARLAPFAACGAMVGAFALAVFGAVELAGRDAQERALTSSSWRWLELASLKIDLALCLDGLSSTMALVVTGVGLLIHVYSAGYMRDDAGYAKFFAFLNLFVAAMLMLILSTNLVGLFVGWEGVGLCSYLLIGFWYARGDPPAAAQKAFVTNRVGDAFFLAGSFLLLDLFGSLDLSAIGSGAAQLAGAGTGVAVPWQLPVAALCLFLGCCGKSAQIPLFTWLPDAMAGPTPVSALIHAATMVTSGLYLVVRLNPLFAASQGVLLVMACVGAATAVVGASSALAQRDIKKVLAYSTVSQLGYMFLALGCGAFTSAIFHVVTHAFFKGLLFLGAGSVIHGLHEEQDLHKMGGLRREMPRTWITFLAGAAALSGLPLFSGFFSKDEILAQTLAQGGIYRLLWLVGLLTAGLTAFYTWRMVALCFYGKGRYDHHHVHPHESGPSMVVPLLVLALLSLGGGLLGLPEVFHLPHVLNGWMAEVVRPGRALVAAHHGGHLLHVSHALEWGLLALGSVVALGCAMLGFQTYRHGPRADLRWSERRPKLQGFLARAWAVDEGYGRWIVGPLRILAFVVSVVVDAFAIDGLVNGAAALARTSAERSRALADGRLSSYALWIGGGSALLVSLWMWA